jgi:hypothetical protein
MFPTEEYFRLLRDHRMSEAARSLMKGRRQAMPWRPALRLRAAITRKNGEVSLLLRAEFNREAVKNGMV